MKNVLNDERFLPLAAIVLIVLTGLITIGLGRINDNIRLERMMITCVENGGSWIDGNCEVK